MTFWKAFLVALPFLFLLACSAPEQVEDSVEPPPDIEVGGALPPSAPAPSRPQPAGSEGGTTDSAWEELSDSGASSDPLDTLRSLPIAYEVPETAQVGRSFDVTLAIDATGDDSAADALPGEARIIENSARLTNLVEASLSGSAFEIELTNKERQRLSPIRESVWRWTVTPRRDGSQSLYLEIFAIVEGDESVLLESFDDRITVDIAAEPGESALSANNLRTYIGIVGGIISIMLGLIALNTHRKNRAERKADSAD